MSSTEPSAKRKSSTPKMPPPEKEATAAEAMAEAAARDVEGASAGAITLWQIESAR